MVTRWKLLLSLKIKKKIKKKKRLYKVWWLAMNSNEPTKSNGLLLVLTFRFFVNIFVSL